MALAQADSTYTRIEKLIRRLTASSSQASLSSIEIQTALNVFYTQDFAYGIKLDQMRSVYTFYTQPNIDRYPLDVNFDQGVRAPMYVDNIQGNFYKDRQQFFSVWPMFPTQFRQGGNTVSGTITGIAQPTNPTQITSVGHNLTTGAVITINGVVGMTQLNGNSYTITVIDANTFSLNGVDNTAFGAYISGGTWIAISQTFSFTLPGPFYSREVIIGGVDTSGSPITIADDSNGNLRYLLPNPITSNPLANTNPAVPGMYNINESNPGLNNPTVIGTVNYVTGQFDFTLPFGISLALGTLLTIRVAQYTTGRPITLLFWNNEFTIRPCPKYIHQIKVETYLTPVQFMSQGDVPILNQWSQYLAYGTACEILRQRQDMDGVANLMEGFKRQEGLVLERQGVEELFSPTPTLFNSPSSYSTGPWGNSGSGSW
jgi:hypothetical protein